jgi:hypothetical protein
MFSFTPPMKSNYTACSVLIYKDAYSNNFIRTLIVSAKKCRSDDTSENEFLQRLNQALGSSPRSFLTAARACLTASRALTPSNTAGSPVAFAPKTPAVMIVTSQMCCLGFFPLLDQISLTLFR